MKKKSIFLFLSAIILIIGCDKFYYIPLSKKSKDLTINTKCGRINISLHNWQGDSFDFYQDYQFKDTVRIYKDSLNIFFKNKKYPTFFIKESKGVLSDETLDLIGKSFIRTAFYIDEEINKGDTVQVYPRGYLYCNEKEIALDSLNIVIPQDL